MNTFTPPNPWQGALSRRLAQALSLSRIAHAPLADTVFDAASDSSGLTTRWRLSPRSPALNSASGALSEMLGIAAGAARGDLLASCLHHYRTQLAADPAVDDLGVALAAYLGACRQAFDQEPFGAQRWLAATQWLHAWVIDEVLWDEAPLAERQEAFERFAVLSVALGEWTVQASRQGRPQQASATWMARTSLRGQLGLDLPELCAVLRGLDVTTAANPSSSFDELGATAYRQHRSDPV